MTILVNQKDHPMNPIVIDESDFNKEIHELYEERKDEKMSLQEEDSKEEYKEEISKPKRSTRKRKSEE
jgi:hypothetical protein